MNIDLNVRLPGSRLLTACVAIALAASLSSFATGQQTKPHPDAGDLAARARDEAGLRACSIQTIRADTGEDRITRFPLTLGDREVELVLEPHSLRSPGFRVRTADAHGNLTEAPTPDVTTYRGHISGMLTAMVAASVIDDHIHARIISDGASWTVQPLRDVLPDAQRGLHIVYNHTDVEDDGAVCGVTEERENQRAIHRGAGDIGERSGIGQFCGWETEIAFDADFEYFQLNGSSIAQTVWDIELILNGVSLIYKRDVSIVYELSEIIIRTELNDPYSAFDASTLVGQLRNHWNANHDDITRDVGHLMTGRDLNGPTVGFASIAMLCANPPFAYGLSQSRFTALLSRRTDVTAHELGHSWSASHCNGEGDCGLMHGTVGAGLPGVFGASAIADITNHRADNPDCFVARADPQDPDCNNNCRSDAVDIAIGYSDDCNNNGIPDECDVSTFLGSVTLSSADFGQPEGFEFDNAIFTFSIGFSGPFVIESTRVLVDIDHADNSQLTVSLISPAATTVDLIDNPDATGAGFDVALTDDGAGGSIQDVARSARGAEKITSPPDYQPLEALATLNGESAQGSWALRVGDSTPGDPTTWQSFTVEFYSPGVESDFDLDGSPDSCVNNCPGDATGDNLVSVADLLTVINNWGTAGGGEGDVTADGLVNVADLLAVINNWGSQC